MQDKIKTEIEEIREIRNVKLSFPSDGDGKVFNVSIKVYEGIYQNTWFHFKFSLPENWPNDPPKIRILDKIWHPNIEFLDNDNPDSGRVDIYTRHRNGQPLSLVMIVQSLQFVLIQPNPDTPLNIEAADEQKADYNLFLEKARKYILEMNEEERKCD